MVSLNSTLRVRNELLLRLSQLLLALLQSRAGSVLSSLSNVTNSRHSTSREKGYLQSSELRGLGALPRLSCRQGLWCEALGYCYY
jgi:hypothetical protein